MILERENILTLIGSRRYHSAILTTFSFDFYFFEMKAMKWLRSCGVRNINVFIDGHYYSELMQQATGEEMQLSAGYSLYPVFQKSVFHPKIWMLFGEKEGLLIVGSGNLTNSGNGNNDEIWGAFHFDIRSTENSSVFSSAWDYLSTLSSSVKGQMNEKNTKWILEHSKWLNELPKTKPFQFFETSQKEKVAFLFNTETTSIWNELLKHLSNEKVVEITTISPYYDKNGKVLQELNSLFPSAIVKVILDESGLIPSAMQVSKAFTFYDWCDAGVSKIQYAKSGNSKSKLHGKIIHFKTKNGKEFCLFGSANITPAGLGLLGKNSNAEVSLLIQSEKGGLLNQLGIKLKTSNSKSLDEFTATTNQSIYETIIKNNQFKVQLLCAELIYDEFILHSTGTYTDEFKVVFFDKQNRFLYSKTFSNYAKELKITVNLELGSFLYVQLTNVNDGIISNKLLISDYFLLAKTHPNPKTEEIEKIYNEIQNGELSKVLDLLHYAIFDETENETGASFLDSRRSTFTKLNDDKEPEKLYDLSSYKAIENSGFEKNLLLSSLSLRVLDVLKFINLNGISTNKQADISIDEQEDDLGNINGNEEGEVATVRNLSFVILKSEKRKLMNYFDNLYNYQQEILYGNSRPKTYRPTLTDLTKYLIALELISEYGGKSAKYDEQDTHHFFSYLPFVDDYDNNNVKGCCLNLIGDFLMLARSGFKAYEFDYTKKKIEELKKEALINTIVCLINNRWKDDELHYFFTMALNALHYLGCRNVDDFNSNFVELKSKINIRISELKNRTKGFEKNLEIFYERLCPSFIKVIEQIEDKNFDASAVNGQIIYKSPWGYSYVQYVNKTNDFTLIRPGFMWDYDKEDYIKHSPDEIYLPLKLSSFICTDL
jgi:hypothetical protein